MLDPSSQCHYWHLKLRALNGGRDKLSERELSYVGLYPPRPRDGWQQPDAISILAPAELEDDPAVSEACLVLLQHLISPEHARHTDF